jgi:hypothetical protein
MTITDKGKFRKIKGIVRRYYLDLCVKCGTDGDFIDKKELDHLKCSVCGFDYHPNFHMNYIEAIENIIKQESRISKTGYKKWRKFYMKLNDIDEIDLDNEPEWEKEIEEIYKKAREE